MANYLLVVIIAIVAVGAVGAWYARRAHERSRIPSLNSLRDASKRGVQRNIIRARTDTGGKQAANAMLSDLGPR